MCPLKQSVFALLISTNVRGVLNPVSNSYYSYNYIYIFNNNHTWYS